MLGSTVLKTTIADPQGNFAFTELVEGDYVVAIESSGYHTYRHYASLRYPSHEEENFSVRLVPAGLGLNRGRAEEKFRQKVMKFFERGLRASQEGKHEQAAKHYAKAVSTAPNFVQAWNNLGGEYRMLKRWEPAEQALRRALALDPESAQARVNLGMVLLGQGKKAEAARSLEEAVKKDPGLASPHFFLGMIAYQKRDMEMAQREFQRTLELDPEAMPGARVYLASVLAWQGNLAQATRQLEVLLKNHPTHPQAANAEQLLRRIRNSQAEAKLP
jgi:tetratricopeptide (TPR) repeat protein